MSASIKLLYIIDCYKNPYAGTEGQLLKLIQGLSEEKFEATFVVFRGSEYLRTNSFPIQVDILEVEKLSSPLSWMKLFCFFRGKKQQGYGLAHIFFNDASMICPAILKLLGYKVIISRRDMGYWYNWLNLAVLRINRLFVDLVIANSEAVKHITMAKEGFKSEDVAVIYNGYQELDRSEADVDCLMKGLLNNPDEDTIRIVLVANIRSIKRIHDAIYAIKIVRDSNSNVALYIIGDGDQSQLRELSGNLDIVSSIQFLGPREDVLNLLPLFDIGVLCSESEGFSNTLVEYMQSSLPVICSSVGGNTEIVENGITGFLYEVGDTQVLAKHIQILAEDEQLRDDMGHAGANKVKNNYSQAKFIDLHQRLYENLLSR